MPLNKSFKLFMCNLNSSEKKTIITEILSVFTISIRLLNEFIVLSFKQIKLCYIQGRGY